MKTKLLKKLRRSKVIAEWSRRMRWREISRVYKTGKAHICHTDSTEAALRHVLRLNRRWRLVRKYCKRLEVRHAAHDSKEIQRWIG